MVHAEEITSLKIPSVGRVQLPEPSPLYRFPLNLIDKKRPFIVWFSFLCEHN